MRIWLVCEVDYELHKVLAAFSDKARAYTYKDLLDEHFNGFSSITVEGHEVDPPREDLPGQYVAWVEPDGSYSEDDVGFELWEPEKADGVAMSDGGGRGHGETREDAIANARKYASVQRGEPE